MRMCLPGWATYRAVIAVAALYALALQGILGSIGFAGTPDPLHVLCAQGTAADGNADESSPVHRHAECCLAAHALGGPVAPPTAFVPLIWPLSRGITIVRRPEVAAAPRAPPGTSSSPRAPPVV